MLLNQNTRKMVAKGINARI